MNCREWMERLERLAPPACACEWDNPGLMTGRADKEIRKILIALDADDEAVKEAVSMGADLLLTHHPLIFRPVKKVNDMDFIGRRLVTLLRHDICCYAMHTNFDAAPGCMADLAAGRLGLLEPSPLEVMGEKDGTAWGIGKTGWLPAETRLRALAEQVKEAFGLPFVTVYGAGDSGRTVLRAAVCPGSGKGMTGAALAAGAQVLITGDIGHHDGIDAADQGLAVIDAGHYGLEHIFIDFMADFCRKEAEEATEIRKMPVHFPAVSW